MPTVDVVDLEQSRRSARSSSPTQCSAPKSTRTLLYEAVRHYLAGTRGGNAKTKTRHEVAGFGQEAVEAEGHRPRSYGLHPLAAVAPWRHGPRSGAARLRYKLPRKMQLGALRSALSAKLRDGELKVVQAFDLGDHKTKNVVPALKTLEATRKVLLVEYRSRRRTAT